MLFGDLRRALEVAREILKLAPQIQEAAEALAELRRRQGREAEAGDLDDSVRKLRGLV